MTVIIETENFDQLVKNIEKLTNEVKLLKNKSICENWLSLHDTCKFLNVSKTSLLNYRNKGLLTFSQIESKIYFRYSDLEAFLLKHQIKAFKK
jgi:hypothetical protein